MPKKEAPSAEAPPPHGFNDVVGVVLLSISLLLFVAMFTFDKADVRLQTTAINPVINNWTGRWGAHLAHYFFVAFGAGAFVMPVLLLIFGLGCFFPALHYLRRRWPWALVLFLSGVGMLDLHTDPRLMDRVQANPRLADTALLERLATNLGAPSAGGVIGENLNKIFGNFGPLGASILYVTLYGVCLLFLTRFNLGAWLRARVNREPPIDPNLSPEEQALERRARDLEKQARQLQQQVEKSRGEPRIDKADRPDKGDKTDKADKTAKPDRPRKPETEPEPAVAGGPTLGADLQPIPTPTIRDLSMPQARPVKPAKPGTGDLAADPANPIVAEGEVIPASEVRRAASAVEILGKSAAKLFKRGETPPVPAIEMPPAPPGPNPPVAAAELAAVAAPAPTPVAGDPAPGAPAATPENPDPAATPGPALPAPSKPKNTPRRPKPIAVAAPPKIGDYVLPSLDMLSLPDLSVKPTETKEELLANARLMQQTLAQFDIQVELGDITRGPTITRYELHPAPGVKLEKIGALANNMAAALKAERLNILAPVPGKSSVGVEVPNAVKTKVIMRDLLESDEWVNSKARLPLALGKDVYGHPIIADLAEMPHCLIAGSTGSGKSVCINAIIASLLYKYRPDELRMVMIDPKVVELQQYNSLPHLVVPVVTDPKKVILALRWVVNEMEKRYQIFAKVGVRNIKSFNERPKPKPEDLEKAKEKERRERQETLPLTAKREKVEMNSEGFAVELDEEIVVPRDEDIVIPEKLSYIVVIIDELADLMLVAPADVEMAIARITQMARAAGIHCIVATQRPSVDVITGVIKANIPARIAFQVAAKVDSRTILDQMGADKLLGKGDMLYLPPGSGRLTRAQGVLITDQEIQTVVDHIASQGKPSYEMEIHQALQKAPSSLGTGSLDGSDASEADEDLIEQCIEVIRSEKKASVSLLQRRLRLGYGRAARIMDELESRGIVGPSKGAEPRDILIDLDGEGHDGGGVHGV